MNDTSVSSSTPHGEEEPPQAQRDEDGETGGLQWLLLTHHLPPEPAYFRVKVRRRLERIGAVPLKNSVYALPPGDDTLEDFEWLSREIRRNGGETSLCRAAFLDQTDRKLVENFQEARRADYLAVAETAARLIEETEKTPVDESTPSHRSKVSKLREQLAVVKGIDFFNAPGRIQAERAIDEVEESLRKGASPRAGKADPGAGRPYVGRTWVTRAGVKVDRIASAWVIRRFIDPAAAFRFVPSAGPSPQEDEVPFDMFEGEFTHVGDACTFETLLDRFALADPALHAIGEIVHDIDCKDEKYGRTEAAGIASIIQGIVAVVEEDARRLELGSSVFDALYEGFRVEAR